MATRGIGAHTSPALSSPPSEGSASISRTAQLAAALADRYTLDREIGAGGMATVYLAHDIKHERDVAIKVLHPDLGAALGGERFLTEIRTTARLQHPHILPLLDSGAAEGLLYYVMPLVTGETLRTRLERERQLPIPDAVRIATEVASALDYAHRQGVIHRDIKPENILLHDGQALVADFGIALAVQSAGGARMTQTGLSLGTPQYMSPEQAMGEKVVDARSDVYALAAVTYEMLAGDPPFAGGSVQAIVARIMTERPTPLRTLRDTVPVHVEDAVLTALAKLPADRFATAALFAGALTTDAPSTTSSTHGRRAPAAAPPNRGRLAAALAAVAVTAAALGWLVRGANTSASAPSAPIEFAFRLGDGAKDQPALDISHDGRRLAMAAADSTGITRVVLRDLGSTALTTVANTDGARYPRFSPEGKWLAILRNGQVQKVPVDGGPVTVLQDSVSNGDTAWSTDGAWIIFSRNADGLWRVPATGGTAERLTVMDTARREFNHWSAQALPDGKTVIYTSYATPLSRARIEAVDVETGDKSVLVEGAVFGRYANGYLFHVRDAAVFASRFDLRTLTVQGSAVPVIEDVAWSAPDALAGFAVAPNGTMTYLKASEWNSRRQVLWVDRAGRTEPAIPDTGFWAEPRLSPDGKWIALTKSEPKRDVWLFDRGRGVLSQLTRAPAAAFNPLWSLDSRSVVYSNENPVYDLNRIPIDGSAASTVLLQTGFDKRAHGVSPDGRRLVYTESVGQHLLSILPLDGGAPVRVDDRSGSQRGATFSPDGQWLAYDEATRDEQPYVYARRLDGQGGRIQVSPTTGDQPRWTRGGRELVYRSGDAMVAIEFDPATGDVGTPKTLFTMKDAGRLDNFSYGYDVTPDGSRFLLVSPLVRADVQPTHVVLNWLDQLNAKLPQ